MTKQVTLGWDYWNKKKHNLRRDMLQLHYYLLLEPTISVRPQPPLQLVAATKLTRPSDGQAESFGLCFSTKRSGFMRGCLPCEDAGSGSAVCEATGEGCARDTTLAAAQVRDFFAFNSICVAYASSFSSGAVSGCAAVRGCHGLNARW